MTCKNCGFLVEQGSDVCPNCGSKIDNTQNNYVNTNNVSSNENNAQTTNNYINNNLNQTNLDTNTKIYDDENKKSTSKKNNKNKLLIIVAIIVLALVIPLCVFLGIKFADKEDENLNINNKTLTLDKVSFKYNDSKWKLEKDETDKKTLTNKESTIYFKYNFSKDYYTIDTYIDLMKESYKKEGYNISENMQDITINNVLWKKVEYEKDDNKYIELIYVKDYIIYRFIYTSPSKTFDSSLKNIEEIYNTLEYDDEEDRIDAENAKRKLIGEWQWEGQGYIVIDDTHMYVYRDSSKDENNVVYGTYKLDSKIPTYSSGYADGLYIVMTIDKYYEDGIELNNYKEFTYSFTVTPDGKYSLENESTHSIGYATKVE